MFNPCYPFTRELLDSMVQKEVVHYVRSTYKRGLNEKDNDTKAAFLISHYHDPAEAERHFNAIHNDPNRAIYDARKPDDLEKLKIAASQPEGFKVFSRIMIPGIEKKITTVFREHTKRYLFKNTNWDLKGRVTITPFLYFQLGTLYTRISFQGDEIKIKFEDIENA